MGAEVLAVDYLKGEVWILGFGQKFDLASLACPHGSPNHGSTLVWSIPTPNGLDIPSPNLNT